MTVSFGNAAHLATVWLPELAPTTAQIVSTVLAMLAMTLILTAVAALFAVFCLEKRFTWLRTVLTFALSGALIVACAGGTSRITGTHTPANAEPRASRSEAVRAGQQAALPHGSWTVDARSISADGQKVQEGWTQDDLRKISAAVAASRNMSLGYPGAPAVVETTHMSDAEIAQHGTSFVKDGKQVRCVVAVENVARNNAGQPLTAEIDAVRCAPVGGGS